VTNARINEDLTLIVQASDADSRDSVSITVTVREDPGLPSGSMVEPNVCPPASDGVVPCNPTPDAGSVLTGYVGCTTKFCLQARDKNGFYQVEIEEGSSADESPPPGAVLGPVELFSEGTLIQRCFTWKPKRNQEGFMYEVKFYAGRPEDRINRVIKIDVQRCKYCVQNQESLQSIAADYNLNWLQLWAANVELKDPDHLMDEQLLSLCPVYYVKPEDGIDNLAARFSTDANHIIAMNPDIQEMPEKDLRPGQALCVCPAVCKSSSYHFKQD